MWMQTSFSFGGFSSQTGKSKLCVVIVLNNRYALIGDDDNIIIVTMHRSMHKPAKPLRS